MSLISLMNGITEIYGKGLFYDDGSVVFISLMNESQKSFKLASVCSKAIVLGFFHFSHFIDERDHRNMWLLSVLRQWVAHFHFFD